jgi:hypothetical protein
VRGLVEVVSQRDAGEPLERLHAQLARVDEDLLVVEWHLDPRLAVPVVVVVTVVVMALAGLVGNGVHHRVFQTFSYRRGIGGS